MPPSKSVAEQLAAAQTLVDWLSKEVRNSSLSDHGAAPVSTLCTIQSKSFIAILSKASGKKTKPQTLLCKSASVSQFPLPTSGTKRQYCSFSSLIQERNRCCAYTLSSSGDVEMTSAYCTTPPAPYQLDNKSESKSSVKIKISAYTDPFTSLDPPCD